MSQIQVKSKYSVNLNITNKTKSFDTTGFDDEIPLNLSDRANRYRITVKCRRKYTEL